MSSLSACLLFAALLQLCPAQVLFTDLAGGSGAAGIMFDLQNRTNVPLLVSGLDATFLAPGTADIEIWAVAAGGSYVPVANTPSAWTRIGFANSVNHPGPGEPVRIPTTLSLTIPPGGITGLYVTATTATGSALSYGLGIPTSLGTVADGNEHLATTIGVGRSFPFEISFRPPPSAPLFQGRIHYHVPPRFETNDAELFLRIGGQEGTAVFLATTRICVGAGSVVDFGGSNAGSPFDFAIAPGAALPLGSGALMSPGGQLLHLDLNSPLLFASSGTSIPGALTLPSASNLSFVAPNTAATVVLQAITLSAAQPDGWALSQAAELSIAPPVTPPPSSAVTDNRSFPVNVGCFRWFGTDHTQVFVSDNGRVVFGGPDGNPVPTTGAALAGRPMVGAWVDFLPLSGSSITVTSPQTGLVRIDWINQPYAAAPLIRANLRLEIDVLLGDVIISGLASLPPCPPSQGFSNSMWLGASAGFGVATDLGPTPFAPGASGSTGLELLYQTGPAGPLASGVNTVRISQAPGGLAWMAF